MPDPRLDLLRQRLLHAGVAPRFVHRAVRELDDHIQDLEQEARHLGLSQHDALERSATGIGSIELIAQLYENESDLKHWIFRYPRLARLVLPVAYVLVLPTVPIEAVISNAPLITRWCACFLLGATVTAAMLLVMQLSIAYS